MNKPLILFSLIVFVLMNACSSESEPLPETPAQEDDDGILTEDTIPPTITITGLETEIETNSTIDVSIADESSVETKIFINDQEVHTTTDGTFSYEVNPYTIPTGPASLKITTVDSNGNATEQVIAFTVKHLLMDFTFGSEEDQQYTSVWMFFNDSDGNLLETVKAEVGSTKIYTDHVLDDNFVFYTISKYTLYEGLGTNKGVRITSYKMELGKQRNEIDFRDTHDLSNEVQIKINLEVDDTLYDKYTARGAGYDVFTSGIGPFLRTVTVSYDAPSSIYLRTSVTGGVPGLFDGKKENYSYYKFSPSLSVPEIELDETDLLSAADYIKKDMPPHDNGSLIFDRIGFESQEDLLNQRDHYIYEVWEPNDQYRDFIDLPIIEGMDLYTNEITYFHNGKTFYGSFFGNDMDLTMPNWTLDFGLDNGSIFLNENNDLDYYYVRFYKTNTTDPDNRRYFTWDYRTFGPGEENKNIPLLELPNEILTEMNDDFFNSYKDYLEISSVGAVDFEAFNTYTETVEWLGLVTPVLTPDQRGYREVVFFPNNISGKKSRQNQSKGHRQMKQ